MKVFIESFGCTRRKLEVTKFHRYFALNSYEIVKNPKKTLLTSQIIAGFPTESESDFDDMLQFLKTAHFDEVIVFPYDEKENTAAVGLYPKVPEKTISKRVVKTLNLLDKDRISAQLSYQWNEAGLEQVVRMCHGPGGG